jgi:hypothetical protein
MMSYLDHFELCGSGDPIVDLRDGGSVKSAILRNSLYRDSKARFAEWPLGFKMFYRLEKIGADPSQSNTVMEKEVMTST